MEKYSDSFFTFDENDEISNFLLEYFNFNPDITDLMLYLLGYKEVSIYLENDDMKNLLWKYELTYYMSNEISAEGYQYIALNNYDITKMLYDYVRGSPQSLDSYLLTDYRQSTLTQSTNSASSSTNNVLVDDYQVVDSLTPAGINDLFLDNNIPASGDDYDVKIGIGADWAELNNKEVGDIISLPQPFGTNIQAKIVVTFRAPEYVFPSFSISKPIPDVSEQTYVLMNTKSFLEYFAPVAQPMLFIGFSDLYNDVEHYNDYTSNIIEKQIDNYNQQLNKLLFTFFSNVQVRKFNNINDYNAIQVETVFAEAELMNLLIVVFVIFFLIIIIFTLIILIRKKIKSSAKEIGTLKALGWTPQKIAISFISFPIMIILLGGILAIILGFFVQFLWIFIWKKTYLISAGSIAFPWITIFVVFILPIVILLVISYFSTLKMLKKPTLNLINDVDEYKPNILIRATSGITNRLHNFKNAYRIKITLRSIGKSSVLFISVLFSVLIISFSFSGVNLVNSGTELINESLTFENAFIINNTEDTNYIESSDIDPLVLSYYTFVNLDSNQEAELLQIDGNDEEVEQEINDFFNNYIAPETYMNTYSERAEWFDLTYGSYIENTKFYQSTMVIPWQAFELLNAGINYVNGDSSPSSSEKNTSLSTTGLTMGQYENIYAQYIKYLNYNSSIEKDDDAEIIRPDITMNQVIYNSENETQATFSSFSWDTYIDSYTNKEITNINQLGVHVVSGYDGVLYTREDYNQNESWGEEYVYSYDHDKTSNDVFGNPTVDEFIAQINEDLPESEEVISEKQPTSWVISEDQSYRTREYNLTKYKDNTAEESDNFNDQWISMVPNYNDFSKIINFDDADAKILENYQPKEIEVTSNSSGDKKTVETIPIVIDNHNAERLNVNVGDIYTSGFIDEENNKLYNDLRLSGVNGPVAVEVVGIYNNTFPFGAATLFQYVSNYENNLKTHIIFQVESQQEEYYAFTSNNFSDGDTLLNSFLYNDFYGDYDNIVSKSVIEDQVNFIAAIIIVIFFVFIFFSIFIAISLISISIKEIANDSGREVSTLKALGYSNKRATFLVIMPYLLIMFLSFLIIIPINVLFFLFLSKYISSIFGMGFSISLGINYLQWIYIILGIFVFFAILIYIVYWTFKRQNAIEVLGRD
ncbi:MAG: hypothetical protein HPAVJP_2740 [Candidatus Hepatoplasma vulgare]|nr:MAG: hypothetical protein HPAVJP_2740 [Candidatus Hepatoplasma sp.]